VIPTHLDDFWSVPRLARLGTVRPDGSPYLVPVKAMRDGGRF
jgi:predicted pyridoxine 5'-phosphate oxidase superfamily flavin-nucleotide-binding protein